MANRRPHKGDNRARALQSALLKGPYQRKCFQFFFVFIFLFSGPGPFLYKYNVFNGKVLFHSSTQNHVKSFGNPIKKSVLAMSGCFPLVLA